MRFTCAALAAITIVACSVDPAPSQSSPGGVDTLPDGATFGGSDGGASDGTVLGDVVFADGPTDARANTDTESSPDASDASSPDTSTSACGSVGADYQCTADGDAREHCVNGTVETESCSRGCLHVSGVTNDVCMGNAGTDTPTCNGDTGTVPSSDGDYYLSEFGCWADSSGGIHLDSGDDCIPDCLSQAVAAGLCTPGDASTGGPACEETLDYYVADDDRFGCLSRVRVSNPTTGVAVVAIVIDGGPLCSLEQSVDMEVLNASGPVNNYLFGGYAGAEDHTLVHVVQVDPGTPLGPTP
jgi:hypothetical protein